MKTKIFTGIFACFLLINLFNGTELLAQTRENAFVPTEGLILKLPWFRGQLREIDPVNEMLVKGTWKAPVIGEKFLIDETEVAWDTIKTDENGWFRGRGLARGYLYIPYESDKEQILLLEGMGHGMVYVNGDPRAGNRYAYKETWDLNWGPRFDYSILPIKVKKGVNHLLFHGSRVGGVKIKIYETTATAMLNANDPTLPDFLANEPIDTWGAVVVMNANEKAVKNLKISAQIGDDVPVVTEVPVIAPVTVRKVGFQLKGKALAESDSVAVKLKLYQGETLLDEALLRMRVKNQLQTHKQTFISAVDGSVQYYGVNPAQGKNPDQSAALVLSVHGAGVEGIDQAASYYSKTWANIVSPTNRRAYGFNWEDWGRLDALEVYDLAVKKYHADPSRIYLTGHSMGGHGTWHLGSLFPDRFGAIAPSAGWLSFWSYRVREAVEEETPLAKMLMRPNLPSQTMEMAPNYKQLGIYILHGSDDDNVPAEQSRQMVEHLNKFHKDFIYHEQPGAGHWWDNSDEPGADCLDWPDLFDFLARHARPEKERIRHIQFLVANPGISAQNNWITVEAQQAQLSMSKVDIQFDPGKKRFVGTTDNVARLAIEASALVKEAPVLVELDSQKIENITWEEETGKFWLEKNDGKWQVVEQPAPDLKGPHRYGTFKDAFKNRMIFVYGTNGNSEENHWARTKARYDAEQFWYQGNGAVDVIPDTEFDPKAEPDRNVILYGNSKTNRAWKSLLKDSPVQVKSGEVTIGKRKIKGKDIGCFLVRPRPNSDVASVGVVGATGIVGMRLTNNQSYLSPGFAYPDVFVFDSGLLTDRVKGVKATGFFGLDWSLENSEIVWRE